MGVGGVIRQRSEGMTCASRIPLQPPCPSCALGCLCLLISLRLSEMISPVAFPICVYEKGMLLHQVCHEHCRSFQSPSYPSQNSHAEQSGTFAWWVPLYSMLV